MSTEEIIPMSEKDVLALLKKHLRLDVHTTSEYVGDLAGGDSLYKDCHVLRLMLDGEVIDEVYL